METAAKAGNYVFVKEKNDELIALVELLIDNINILLDKIASNNPKPKKEKPELDLLKKLLTACKNFDMDDIEAQIDELDSYEYESGGDLVTELVHSANQFKFKEISEKLSVMLDKEEL